MSKETAALQSRQYTKGKELFNKTLAASNKELVRHVNREWDRTRMEMSRRGIKSTAMKILQRNRAAEAAVKTVSRLEKEVRYGHLPSKKPNDVVRLLFENWSTLQLWKSFKRVETIEHLRRTYEVDILLGAEHRTDFRFAEEAQKFANLFGAGEPRRGMAGYNTTEPKRTRELYGGTAAMAFGRLAGQVIEVGADETKLGRWTWILFGNGNVRTRVIVAYQPCTPSSKAGDTVFAQQARYFESIGNFTSPRTLFYTHLVAQLVKWKEANEEIILFGDFNENVYSGRLAKRLAEQDLNMTE